MKCGIKLMCKRGKGFNKLYEVLKILSAGNSLPEKNKDHNLSGKYSGYRECHIDPDWLLIYKVVQKDLILVTIRTGTHSDLFNA